MKKSASKKPSSKSKSAAPAAYRSSLAQRKTVPQKRAEVHKTIAKSPEKKARSAQASHTAKPAPVLRREPTPAEIQHQKNVVSFEVGVKLFNQGELQKARGIFESLSRVASQDLAQRARVYLTICERRLSHPSVRLKTADEFYDYAVSMANKGQREEAENNLQKALRLAPKSDYIYYALATTQALRENVEAALENLQKAIELNAKNRYLAQSDADFANLEEDPRFTELIYPERPVS